MSGKGKADDAIPGGGNEPQPGPSKKAAATLEAALEKIEALEAKIAALEEGEKEWTEKNLSPLRQQIADLQATLAEIPPNVTGQVKTLKEELTQQLHELQQAVTHPQPSPPLNPDNPAPPLETPPPVPPEPPAPPQGAPEGAPVKTQRGKRVV